MSSFNPPAQYSFVKNLGALSLDLLDDLLPISHTTLTGMDAIALHDISFTQLNKEFFRNVCVSPSPLSLHVMLCALKEPMPINPIAFTKLEAM